MMRRSPFRTMAPPRRPARQWEGGLITPRAPALCLVDLSERLVVPLPKENALQHTGYMNLVRALPCIHCYATPRSQFCHRDETKGQSIKTDCREGYPGCAACHHKIGTARIFPKGERRRIELLYGQLTRAKIIAAGTWPKRLPLWPVSSTA
jgi:hypothetical protein